ncbi:hypothetical protein [Capnocytophaga leadbetteri]|jgi:hypothetical protein|uniref:hypothetical protein n=1 Tax=Capnocytophaga leadbetteri TaxID=327575 RepID=UPI0026EB4530|nr:hypothetical protein [Capnocytophaga leadbetteri]
MNANAQYIKDAQGNDILAVIPIESYNEWRFEKADLNNTQEIADWQKEILDESLRELELTGEAEDWDVLKFKIKQRYGF